MSPFISPKQEMEGNISVAMEMEGNISVVIHNSFTADSASAGIGSTKASSSSACVWMPTQSEATGRPAGSCLLNTTIATPQDDRLSGPADTTAEHAPMTEELDELGDPSMAGELDEDALEEETGEPSMAEQLDEVAWEQGRSWN